MSSEAARALLAQHLPRMEYRGGPFMRHPRIVTITFRADDKALVSRLEQFGETITRTPWWRAVTEGYCAKDGDCIGEGQPGMAVRLDDQLAAEVHAVELSALLRRYAQAGRFGVLDENTLLVAYLPPGVHLRDAFVARYCGDGPRGFHRALRMDKRIVGFAVLPRCGDEAALTGTASHEILETAANPDTSQHGFALVPSSVNLAFSAAGVEPVDPCGLLNRGTHQTQEGGFVVQRAWSNRAAANGQDPCVPAAPARPYLALIPQQRVIRLTKPGDSVTVSAIAVADRPGQRWSVSATDLTGARQRQRYLEVSLSKSEVSVGEKMQMTVTLRKSPPSQPCIIGLISSIASTSHVWPVAVSVAGK